MKTSQHGGSLVGILVGSAILLITILIVAAGLTQNLGALVGMRNQDALVALDSAFSSTVAPAVGEFVEDSQCGTAGSFANVTFNSLAHDFDVTWLREGLPPTEGGAADHEAAKARCAYQQTFQTAAGPVVNFSEKTQVYFCLLLTPKQGVPLADNSIFRRGPAFAEVAFSFWDFGVGMSRSCGTLIPRAASPAGVFARGGVLVYTIYWRGSKDGGAGYYKNTSSLHVLTHY